MAYLSTSKDTQSMSAVKKIEVSRKNEHAVIFFKNYRVRCLTDGNFSKVHRKTCHLVYYWATNILDFLQTVTVCSLLLVLELDNK
jgi:hypothetical protein